MNVLLVDDDMNFRRSLAIGLEEMGYKAFEAKSGMEALEFLRSNQQTENEIQGVIVDARMPGLDGFWLTDQISLMYPSLKVVILSAYSYPTQRGRYTMLTKPIHIPELSEVLDRNGNYRGEH